MIKYQIEAIYRKKDWFQLTVIKSIHCGKEIMIDISIWALGGWGMLVHILIDQEAEEMEPQVILGHDC